MREKLLAYHLDLKCGLWSRSCMETLVRQLAAWGYNMVVLEIEDKLQFRCAPGVASPDALSHQQMATLAAYCREHGLEVVPLVQSLGHAEYVVGKSAYAHLRESPQVPTQYDPLSSEARELIVSLFDEAIAAIQPTDYFHIGGDETWSLGSSEKARPMVEKHGVGGLYLQHILPLLEHIHQQGLRPMIWADMFLSYPQLLAHVPDYAVLVDWDYWTDSPQPKSIMIWGGYRQGHRNALASMDDYPEVLQKPDFKQHLHPYTGYDQGQFQAFYCTDALRGHGVRDVLLAPANSCGGDLAGIPRNHLHVPNCWYAARKGMRDGCGFLVTSWSVRHVHPLVRQLGTFAAAEAAKPGSRYDFDDICLSYANEIFGRPLADFPRAVQLAAQSSEMCQAYRFVDARAALLRGDDGYRTLMEEQIVEAGGRRLFLEQFNTLREGYLTARRLFGDMAGQIVRGREHLDCWLEGVDLSLLHTDFVLAMCQDQLQQQGAAIAQRLAEHRQTSERLFAPWFTPHGLEQEMQVRYGYHERYLEKLGITAGVGTVD